MDPAFDVAILDPNWPDVDVIQLCDSLQQRPEPVRVVVLDDWARANVAQTVLATGVLGYCCQRDSLEEIGRMVNMVADGAMVICRHVAPSILQRVSQTRAVGLQLFSTQDREILQCVAAGLSNRQIAGRLGCEEHIVRYRIKCLSDGTGCSRRSSLAAHFVRSTPWTDA